MSILLIIYKSNTHLKLTSHGILYYLWSVDLSKSFSQLICQYLSVLNIFFNKFFTVEKCGVIPHCLYRDSVTLISFTFEMTYLIRSLRYFTWARSNYFNYCNLDLLFFGRNTNPTLGKLFSVDSYIEHRLFTTQGSELGFFTLSAQGCAS